MPELTDIADVEGALMDYLRAYSLTVQEVDTRTFLAVTDPDYPYIQITRIGGPADGTGAGDVALVQFDVIGAVRALRDTNDARRALRRALLTLEDTPYSAPGKGKLIGAQIRDDRRFPDEGQDGSTIGERPRYIVTASVYCVALAAA